MPASLDLAATVALRMEGEDRNVASPQARESLMVALRMEGEDRNDGRM